MKGAVAAERIPGARPARLPLLLRLRRQMVWTQLGERQVLMCCLLLGLAFALRLPFFMQVPAIDDEISENGHSLRIWRGYRPLTGVLDYMGPVFSYLVAGLFYLFGPNMYAPRLAVLVLGALTAPLAYLLVREVVGPRAGLLAGLLAMASPTHIAVNSHIAYANATSPFYVAAGLWALARGLQAGRGFMLVPAGMAFGLGLDSHPSSAVILPGVAAFVVWFVLRRRAGHLLRAPWPYLGLAAFFLMYAPMIWFNWDGNLPSLFSYKGATIASPGKFPRDWPHYWYHLGSMLLELVRMSSGVWQQIHDAAYYLAHPAILVYGGMLAWGCALMARRGYALLSLPLCSAILIMPLLNRAYGLDPDEPPFPEISRYIAFLMPLTAAALALALEELIWRARPRTHWPAWRLQAFRAAAIGCLVVYPLWQLAGFYQDRLGSRLESGGMIAAAQAIKRLRADSSPIVVGPAFQLKVARVSASDQLWFLLIVEGVVETSPKALGRPQLDLLPTVAEASRGGQEPYLVLTPQERQQLSLSYCLLPVGVEPDVLGYGPLTFGIYRLRACERWEVGEVGGERLIAGREACATGEVRGCSQARRPVPLGR